MNVNKLTRSFNKVLLKGKKHSPAILMGTAAVGFVGTVVLACKATRKVDEILEEHNERIQQCNDIFENEELAEKHDYIPEVYKKDILTTNVQTGLQLAKIYAPAIALGTFSLGCMFMSHNIMRKRNIALMAAYATIEQGFKKYRGNVVERFGERIDYELKNGIKAQEIEIKEEKEDGTVETKKVVADVIDPTNGISEYDRLFDIGNPNWTKSPELNKHFLRSQQNYLNDKLSRIGYVFLNEVYEALGFPVTSAGAVVGWVYDENNVDGDNYIDFGIFDVANADFFNGYERSVWLSFNPDGVIYDKLDSISKSCN